jgi:predicted nucleic acid-binding Zn ribbon protein
MDSQGPEKIGEILSRLFAARGWGRKQDRLRLERAWAEAVGPELSPQTRVAGIKRNVLEVEVKNAVLLQELTQFHKRRLLEALRKTLTGVTVVDLRFRAGAWTE